MKRRIVALFIMIVSLLTGCASTGTGEHAVQIDGVELIVNTEYSRVTDGQYVYHFTQSEDQISVEYPNGALYTQVSHDYGVGATIHGSGETDGYVEPHILFAAIEDRPRGLQLDGGSVLNILLGIVVIAFGLWSVISPESVWMLENGWKFENAEPSDLALALNKVGGIVAMIGGVVLILAAIFG